MGCTVHEDGFDRKCDDCFMTLLVAEERLRVLAKAIVKKVYGDYHDHPPYTDLESELLTGKGLDEIVDVTIDEWADKRDRAR